MKLYEIKAEMQALRTICESRDKINSAKLLSRLDEKHFYDEGAQTIFRAIRRTVKTDSEIPRWSDLTVTPSIPETLRDELTDYNRVKALTGDGPTRRLYKHLSEFRKARALYFMSEDIRKGLDKDHVNVEDLFERSADTLARERVGALTSKDPVTFGVGSNSKDLIASLLSNERGTVLPTGFATYDSVNGGFLPGSLVVIAGTSGGGKTALAGTMGRRMALHGKKVCFVPLEMSEKECAARHMAAVSQIDTKKFLYTKLTKREQRKALREWGKFEGQLRDIKGAFRIYEPEDDVSIEELLSILRPYDDDIIFVDYVNLLKGVDGDDSWRQLGAAARYAKIWAKNNNKVVVLLTQLSDDGAIRYSRAIKEHANNLWSWVYTDESRETGIIHIIQQKARNQDPFDFQLGHDFKYMDVFDINEAKQDLLRSKRGDSKRRSHRERLYGDDDEIDRYMGDASD